MDKYSNNGKPKYNADDIYECPVCIIESEIDMVKALEQYEEQLAELDEQIEDAEEEYNIVNPFYGLGGARIDDLEYEQKKKGQAQNIAELKQKRKAIKKQIDMINSFLRKK